jgi:hypothetical protein
LIIAPIQTKVRLATSKSRFVVEVEDSPPQGKVPTAAGCFLDAATSHFGNKQKGRHSAALPIFCCFVCSGDRLRLPLPAPAQQI